MLLQHHALDTDLHLTGFGFPRGHNPSRQKILLKKVLTRGWPPPKMRLRSKNDMLLNMFLIPKKQVPTEGETNMPAKTLYVKDEQLWEKAKHLAGHQGFSGVIMQLLAKWVADREKQNAMKSGKEFTEIELWVGGEEHRSRHPKDPLGGNYKIAFTGRLVDSTEGEVCESTESGLRTYRGRSITPLIEVYEMSNRKLAVYRDFREASVSNWGATCLIYSDLKDLREDSEALDTHWELPQEDEMTIKDVAPFETRTLREQIIVTFAGLFGKEKLKERLPTIDIPGVEKFTEGEIESCHEEVNREAFDLRFQESIANALGAELVVRIDQFPHVSSPSPQIGSHEASE